MLRPYQHTLLNETRAALSRNRRVLMVAPTGAGKTVLALQMIAGAVDRGRRVLFLCHRRELVRQSSRAFWQAGVPHGQIMAGVGRSPLPAQVGVINTVANRLHTLPQPDLIIIDEAHRSTSPMYAALMAHWPDAHVVGLTATPERTDGRGLATAGYTEIVSGPSVRWLIDAGFLSDYRIVAPASSLSMDGVHTRAGDYAQDELETAVDRPTITGEAVAAYQQFATGKRCMVFCVSIKHSQHVCEQYNSAGITAEHVDGTHSDTEREAALARFRAGTTLVLCTVQLAIEGLDVPAIEAVQFLRPTKSIIVYLQAIGRGLRAEPGKTHCIILDQVANWTRHGLPDDERQWSIDGRKTAGKRKNEQPELSVRQCPAPCYAVFRAELTSCPQCGAAVVATRTLPQTVDGTLAEIDIAAARAQDRRAQGSARGLPDLVALGVRRGIRNPAGWAANVYAAREGRKPNRIDYKNAADALEKIRNSNDSRDTTHPSDHAGAF